MPQYAVKVIETVERERTYYVIAANKDGARAKAESGETLSESPVSSLNSIVTDRSIQSEPEEVQ